MATLSISNREIEIIRKIAEGLNTFEISQALFISPMTVKTHRKNIIRKAGVRNMAQLVHFAWSRGLMRAID